MTKIEKIERQIEELDKLIDGLVSSGHGGGSDWQMANLELNHLLVKLSKAQVEELERSFWNDK